MAFSVDLWPKTSTHSSSHLSQGANTVAPTPLILMCQQNRNVLLLPLSIF